MKRTLVKLMRDFYWANMCRQVEQFIHECSTCQQVKPFNIAPQIQLHPLKIPGQILEYISMDFITHLPPSHGQTTVLVVVDRLSK